MEVLDLIVFGIGAPLASYLLVFLVMRMVQTMRRVWPHVQGGFAAPFSTHFADALVEETGAQLWIGHHIVGFAKLKKSTEYYE